MDGWRTLDICLPRGQHSINASYVLVFIFPSITGKRKERVPLALYGAASRPSYPPKPWKWYDINNHCALSAKSLQVGDAKRKSWTKTSVGVKLRFLAGYWLNNTLALRPIFKLEILHQEPLCSQSHLISKEGMLQLAIQELFYILVTMHKN